MSQQWPQSQTDQRNFGQQQQRTLDDLNRPNLQGQVTSYLQDSMRYWQRKPFFFTDTDNTARLSWQASVQTTVGTTIQFTAASGVVYNFVAANAGTTGSTPPNFNSVVGTIFTPPSTTQNPPPLPPPAVGTPGTIADFVGPPPPGPPFPLGAGVLWLNNGPVIGGFAANTQLTTLYNVNQYVPPIDLVAFTRVEVTWASSMRLAMEPLSYEELRNYDVIRPTPPTTYPTKYCWYQQQLYLWPYPVGLYPITLSYRSAPPIAIMAGDSNIWTTQAEAMVRYYAAGRINELMIGDQAMAQMFYSRAEEEYLVLQQQTSQQDVRAGIPPSEW